MKIATLIARILLGLLLLISGLNKFHTFIPQPMPTGLAAQFFQVLFASHYLLVIATIEVITAILLLANRYIPLALTLVGPIVVNILLYHSLLDTSGLPLALITVILWFTVFAYHRAAFAGIFSQNA